jgi:hypothetical protein
VRLHAAEWHIDPLTDINLIVGVRYNFEWDAKRRML